MSNEIKILQEKIDKLHGNYIEVLPLTIQLLDITQACYGNSSVEYAVILNDLGGIYRHLGQYPEAETAFNAAMTILADKVGVADPNYATALNNLAGLYRLTKTYEKSEKLFQLVISIYQNTLGHEHFLTLSALNNLGLVYQDMKRYDDARNLHEKCLALLTPQKKDHPLAYATTLNNLASVYAQTGAQAKALETTEEVLTLYRQQVGDMHPLYVNALNNYASLIYQKGDLLQAKSLFEEANTLNLKLFGQDSETYKASKINLKVIHQALENKKQSPLEIQALPGNTENALENLLHTLLDVFQSKKTEHSSNLPGFGLGLCQRYFETLCFPVLKQVFPDEINRMAIGLVGEGSECFGFDDELSQDHDFGPRLMIWLTDEDYARFGDPLQQALTLLPRVFEGFQLNESAWGQGREGVFTISDFYARYIGTRIPPQTLTQWQALPESHLATATNGAVFYDPLGQFTQFREQLLSYYPEDIRLKKIAARCMQIAQAGQYNFSRSLKRNDLVAVNACGAEFIEAGISLIFLLNKRYKPFYKWMHCALQELPILGNFSFQIFNDFVSVPFEQRLKLIETFCTTVIHELTQMQLTDIQSDFLLDHGPAIMQNIQDHSLRHSNPWVG